MTLGPKSKICEAGRSSKSQKLLFPPPVSARGAMECISSRVELRCKSAPTQRVIIFHIYVSLFSFPLLPRLSMCRCSTPTRDTPPHSPCQYLCLRGPKPPELQVRPRAARTPRGRSAPAAEEVMDGTNAPRHLLPGHAQVLLTGRGETFYKAPAAHWRGNAAERGASRPVSQN